MFNAWGSTSLSSALERERSRRNHLAGCAFAALWPVMRWVSGVNFVALTENGKQASQDRS